MLGNLIIEAKKRGVSQKQMADVIGVTQQSLSKKINGANQFKLDEMTALRNTFFNDCTFEFLFAKT